MPEYEFVFRTPLYTRSTKSEIMHLEHNLMGIDDSLAIRHHKFVPTTTKRLIHE